MYNYIKDNLNRVNERIDRACHRAGRSAGEITLVAVSKTFPVAALEAAISFGITELGESRIQEAEPKITSLGHGIRWHLIGHLQTNKAKKAVDLFGLVQSLDSLKLAEALERHAAERNLVLDCLAEVNSSGEAAKFGMTAEKVFDFVEKISQYKHINIRGLMTVGPLTDNVTEIRRAFALMRTLWEKNRSYRGSGFDTLSMGMSGDYEMAVREGATMVRVGTALFGQRAK